MDRAWATRRSAFDAPDAEATALLEDARDDLRTAVAICRDQRLGVELAEALHRLANLERDLGERTAAEAFWNEAIGICRALDRPLMLAHKVRHLADLKHECEQVDAAESLYEEAMAIYRDPANSATLDHANAAMAFAELRSRQGMPDVARALLSEARDLYSRIDLKNGVEMCERQMAELE